MSDVGSSNSAMTGWRPLVGRIFGGGPAQQPQQNNGGGNQNGNSRGQNAAGDNQRQEQNNLELSDDIWSNEPAQSGNANGGNNNQNQNGNGNQPTNGGGNQQVDQRAAFQQFVDSLDFSQQITPEVQNKLSQGDWSGINDLLNGAARQVFAQAIEGANRIIESRVTKAVDEAVSRSAADTRVNTMIQRMETQLPYTAKPNLAPVARSVLAQFTRKGDNLETAIKKVDAYFKDVANMFGGRGNGNRQTGGAPGQNGFRGGDFSDFSGSGNENQQEDWVSVLTQQPRGGNAA